MDRAQKEQTVADLKEKISSASIVVVTHYKGLTVADVTELRKKSLEHGASFKVAKNSLAKLAIKDTQYSSLSDLFAGPTAVAYSNDPVAAAKVVVDFAKDNDNLVVLGGALNEQALDVSEITSLAKLPSLDELRAKIVGMISTPATRIAGVVQAPAGQLARVVNAHSQQG